MTLFKLCLTLLFFVPVCLFAGYDYDSILDRRHVANLSVQEHYSLMQEAYQKEEWSELAHQGHIVMSSFIGTHFAQEAAFYLAKGYFQMEEFEKANEHFSTYLRNATTLKHFESLAALSDRSGGY